MTTTAFQNLIAKCRTPRELEVLLQRWHEIEATKEELDAARNAWIARSMVLAEDAECGATAKVETKELQPA